MLHAALGFMVAAIPLTVIPGASLTLLAHRVASYGRRAGFAVALGTVTGLYVHATLAAAGLSALVMRSAALFTVVRLVGAAYLVVLGLWMWRAPTASPAVPTARSTYLQALLGNVLNVKAASIYLTLAPQFLDPARPIAPQLLAFATAHAAFLALWLLGWTAVLGSARTALRSGAARVTRRVAGTLLVALGLRAAVSVAQS